MPFNSNSPTGSTFTAFSTFVSTRALMRDLSRLGFIAEAGGDVRDGADCGIVKSALEADSAERSEADAEADFVPPPTPRLGQRSDGLARFQGHEDGL